MSKLIKAILRIGVGVVQLAVSLVVLFSLISAVTVVMNPNITNFIDIDNTEFNISDPYNSNMTIPINLNNSQGLYSFDNLRIHIDLHIYNTTENYTVLTNTTDPFQIQAHEDFSSTLFFGNESFTWDPDLLVGISMNPTDYNITIFVDVSATYALGLIPFRLNVSTSLPLYGP